MNAIVKALREMYAEAHDGDECPLSDKEILAISATVPGAVGENDEADMQRVIALDAAIEVKDNEGVDDEPTLTSNVAATPHQKSWARQEATKIDKAFDAELSTLVAADEKRKQSSVLISEDLRRVFGDDLWSFPVVNTTDEDVKGTNRKADKYSLKIIGADKKEIGSFWGSLADNSPTGKAIQAKLDLLGLSNTEPTSTKLPEDWKNLGPAKRNTLFAKYRGQQAGLRNLFRKGAQLAVKMHEVHTELPNVHLDFDRDRDGVIIVSPKPLHIGEKAARSDEAISVQQLLSYQITDDVKSKGTAEALMATAEREKKDTAATLPGIENAKGATDYVVMLSNYYDLSTSEGQSREATLLAMVKNPKTDDHTIETWYNAIQLLGDVANTVREEHDKRERARDKVAAKKAA